MAFTNTDLVLIAHGNDFKLFHHDSGSDALATVLASGYYNNTDDDIRLTANDRIMVSASDGDATLKVVSVSSGTVTTAILDAGVASEAGTTSANLANTGLTTLSSTAAAAYTLDAPFAGAVKYIFQLGATTLALTVAAGSGITFNGSNSTLTFNTAGEAVILVGQSTTRWLVMVNTGSVGLS